MTFQSKLALSLSSCLMTLVSAQAIAGCPLSQAGQAVPFRACGIIGAQNEFILNCNINTGNNVYGTNNALDTELQKLGNGQALICFDSCTVEGDIDVTRILAVMPATPENCARYSQLSRQ